MDSVRQSIPLHSSLWFISTLLYRHSLHYPSPRIKSEMAVLNFLVKYYKRTRWETNKQSIFLHSSLWFISTFSYRHSHNSPSTAIKSEMVVPNLLVKHYKRTRWETNKQSIFLHFSLSFISTFSYRHWHNSPSTAIKSEMVVPNLLVKHYKRTGWGANNQSLSHSSVPSCTDTHTSLPRQQSNRRWRCPISWWSTKKEQGE